MKDLKLKPTYKERILWRKEVRRRRRMSSRRTEFNGLSKIKNPKQRKAVTLFRVKGPSQAKLTKTYIKENKS
jgi:hypothetical protein